MLRHQTYSALSASAAIIPGNDPFAGFPSGLSSSASRARSATLAPGLVVAPEMPPVAKSLAQADALAAAAPVPSPRRLAAMTLPELAAAAAAAPLGDTAAEEQIVRALAAARKARADKLDAYILQAEDEAAAAATTGAGSGSGSAGATRGTRGRTAATAAAAADEEWENADAFFMPPRARSRSPAAGSTAQRNPTLEGRPSAAQNASFTSGGLRGSDSGVGEDSLERPTLQTMASILCLPRPLTAAVAGQLSSVLDSVGGNMNRAVDKVLEAGGLEKAVKG